MRSVQIRYLELISRMQEVMANFSRITTLSFQSGGGVEQGDH
jgi:hypothetical protein